MMKVYRDSMAAANALTHLVSPVTLPVRLAVEMNTTATIDTDPVTGALVATIDSPEQSQGRCPEGMKPDRPAGIDPVTLCHRITEAVDRALIVYQETVPRTLRLLHEQAESLRRKREEVAAIGRVRDMKIREALAEGISQAKVAEYAGVTAPAIWQISRNTSDNEGQ